jgi:hypothetical protein
MRARVLARRLDHVVALLSWTWRDGVLTIRLELKKKKLGAKPRPPPFPLPPFPRRPAPPTSWLEVEPTFPRFIPEPTVVVEDPAQTLDG